MPPRRRRPKTIPLLPLRSPLPIVPIKPNHPGHLRPLRLNPKPPQPRLPQTLVFLLLTPKPPRYTDVQVVRIAEAKRPFGEGAPGEQVPGGGEGAVVVVPEDDGDYGVVRVLEGGEDGGFEGAWWGEWVGSAGGEGVVQRGIGVDVAH